MTNKQKIHLKNWNPYTSKLEAGFVNGLELFPIIKTSSIIFLESFPTQTLNHLSLIIEKDVSIFVDKYYFNNYNSKIKSLKIINESSMYDLNSELIISDIFNEHDLNLFHTICKKITNSNIFFIVIVNSNFSLTNMKTNFELIQEVNLDNFFKDSFMLMGKINKKNSESLKN